MKITFIFALLVFTIFAKAQVLLTEDFDYFSGSNLLGQGSWGLTGNAETPGIQVTAASISYTGYPGSSVGNELKLTYGEDLNKEFTAQTTGTVYVSFLINVSATPVNSDYFIHIGSSVMGDAFIGRIFIKADKTIGKFVFGILNAPGGTATYSTTTYDINTTHLVVLKHDIVANTSYIVINPSLFSEPTIGWISNKSGTNSTTNIGSVGVCQPLFSSAFIAKLDGIRVATSWSALLTSTEPSNPTPKSFNWLSA